MRGDGKGRGGKGGHPEVYRRNRVLFLQGLVVQCFTVKTGGGQALRKAEETCFMSQRTSREKFRTSILEKQKTWGTEGGVALTTERP